MKSDFTGFRATYYSVHFYNWYHMELLEELEYYLEPLLEVAEHADELAEIIDAKLNEVAKKAWI